MKIKLLGCGSSAGVPVVGCNCNVCISNNIKNQRLRTSALIQKDTHSILIDSGGDFRQQMLRNGFVDLDATLYTHAHQDHTHGIEDMRISASYSSKKCQIFAVEKVIKELQVRFPNSFMHNTYYHPNCQINPNIIQEYDIFQIGNIKIESIKQLHGHGFSTGYIMDDKIAYCTDVSEFPEKSLEILKSKKLNILFIDCVRWQNSHAHFTFENIQQIVKIINPKRAILIHMNHDFDFDELKKKCPSGVEPGFDGMKIEI